MRTILATGAAALSMLAAGNAQALQTTFTFDSTVKGQTSITKTVDGITLTLSNFSTGPKAGADVDGLAVFCVSASGTYTACEHPNNSNYQPYSSFAMSFNRAVKLISYNVSVPTPDAVGSVTTYTQGALQSVQDNGEDAGVVPFTNPFTAVANTPIAVSTTDDDGTGLLQIDKLTVEGVYVPGPLPIAGAAAAFSFSRRLRNRRRTFDLK
jgi:hypothetical protein